MKNVLIHATENHLYDRRTGEENRLLYQQNI